MVHYAWVWSIFGGVGQLIGFDLYRILLKLKGCSERAKLRKGSNAMAQDHMIPIKNGHTRYRQLGRSSNPKHRLHVEGFVGQQRTLTHN